MYITYLHIYIYITCSIYMYDRKVERSDGKTLKLFCNLFRVYRVYTLLQI